MTDPTFVSAALKLRSKNRDGWETIDLFSLTEQQVIDIAEFLSGGMTPLYREREVMSTSIPGKTYMVTEETRGGRVTCTCPGFGYRKHCKHADDVTRRGGA